MEIEEERGDQTEVGRTLKLCRKFISV